MVSAWRHPKFLGCDSDAVALWGMALSWSMDNKTDGHIPTGAVQMILSGLAPARVSRAVKILQTRRLWDRAPGGYTIHDFLDYNFTIEQIESFREAGRKGAAARWNRGSDADRNADRIPDRNGEVEVELEVEEDTPPIPPRGGEGFDLFWAAYPKKVAHIRARRTWDKLNPDRTLVEKIIAAVKRQAASPEWTKDRGRWIPAPTGWLRDRRWEDEPVVVKVVEAPTASPEVLERERQERERLERDRAEYLANLGHCPKCDREHDLRFPKCPSTPEERAARMDEAGRKARGVR